MLHSVDIFSSWSHGMESLKAVYTVLDSCYNSSMGSGCCKTRILFFPHPNFSFDKLVLRCLNEHCGLHFDLMMGKG